MLTNFGKELRKLRIDHDELLKDMASNLGVTVAYLSAVENGKREVPDTWIDVLGEKYQLSSDELAILQSLAYEGKSSLKIDLSKIESEERELALAFARSFKSLSDEEMKEIRKILGR
ncbi:helix-turn-helix domain-containing protein [Blautia argi]|uniref:Transcriptional regulator n=1 Tax=Blautia argi TaxID=1912897 RepID=A0A2Z4UCX9_9FIRM|nr:helix-turn-helix transcriptional regulator [Blautia argi]AWY98846.1 transcriptional regulator [Blautia argi]